MLLGHSLHNFRKKIETLFNLSARNTAFWQSTTILHLPMSYTKSDLGSESGEALLDAIFLIGKELEKSDTPTSKALSAKLLENFNQYDKKQLATMFVNFQRLLERCVTIEDTLDINYVVEHNLATITDIIGAKK
jgi:hypothetical protein